MANSKQAAKRARQSLKNRADNRWQVSRMSSYIKNVLAAIAEGNAELATKRFSEACSIIDRLVSRGVIHKNKAARKKSRLNAQVKALAA